MPHAPTAYRRDIDGLRAIAVLSVIVHHVAPGLMPGGFVGVDVFFVISGFLVTRLIDEDLHAHRFRYVEFLLKRCRRIVPALVALLLGTFVMGACVLTGPEFVSLARHAAAGSVSASNLLLYSEVGYFDSAAALKPLLHLWSLGVEEQFYLLWPVMLSLLPLDRRLRVLAIGALVVGSLLLSENLAYSDPAQAFYLLHSRAWELGAGGLLALLPAATGTPVRAYAPALRSVAAFGGAVLLAWSLGTTEATATWPGLAAAIPVAGTLLLLAAGPDNVLSGTVLSSRISEWIGQRSYALYLWHWPPLALLHIIAQEQAWSAAFTQRWAVALMVPVVVIADVTFRWIEQPIRRHRAPTDGRVRAAHLSPYLGALATCVVVALVITRAHGFPSRYGTLAGVDATSVLNAASGDSITTYDRVATRCRLADKGTATWCWRVAGEGRGVAVIGDSHAEVVFAGLVAERTGAPLFLTGRKGCAPIVQDAPIAERTAEICRRASLIAHEAIRTDASIGTVLIVSRGPAYITGSGFGIDSLRPVVPVAVGASRQDSLVLRDAYVRGLERAITAYQRAGKRVVLVTGVPEIGFLPAECVLGRPFGIRSPRHPCGVPRAVFEQRNAAYRSLIQQVAARHPGLDVHDASAIFCDAALCHAERQSQLLYQDGNHLTLAGSRLVAAQLQSRLTPTGLARSQD